MEFRCNYVNILAIEIFKFVESIFLLGIVINFFSYVCRFLIIYRNEHTKVFLRTLKEGLSRKILIRNGLSISLLITSISVFWYMLKISKGLKPFSIQVAYSHNSPVTIYILFASFSLLIYSLVLSVINIYKIKELTPTLSYLAFWNSTENFFHILGGGVVFKPITEMSKTFRRYLIQSKLSEVLIGALVFLILEYLYKILIVLALVFLLS